MRVIAGEVVHPDRLRKRHVPRELSAVAMKALALRPEDRYPTAEAFRDDIERFLEGRSVSAKEDSPLEQVVKLIKRNRGLSAAMAGAMAVITVILWVSFHGVARARDRAEQALEQLSGEQRARREQGRHSAPSFLKDARASVGRDDLEYALAQVNVALEYDPDLEGALLFKGQVLTGMKRFAEAVDALQAHLKRRPKDKTAHELEELCRGAKEGDLDRMRRMAEVLTRQDELALAGTMLRAGEDLLTIYRERLEAAWPGRKFRLSLLSSDSYKLELFGGRDSMDSMDLAPLRGMRLSELSVAGSNELQDLTALRGMSVARLSLIKCYALKDLSPLKGMKLTYLDLSQCYALEDLSPLVGMPLTELNLSTCREIRDLAPLRGMPLTKLNISGMTKVTDLSPLGGMPLTYLAISGCSEIHDLSPLEGMPLTFLDMQASRKVTDFTPLKGMPLRLLVMQQCSGLKDLSFVKGMPLENLRVGECHQLRDLSPLEKLPLVSLNFPPTATEGVAKLRNIPSLKLINSRPAEQFWKEYDAMKK